MIILKMIREDFEIIREVIEERVAKTSGREAEALKGVLEAFRNAETEDSELKVEMNLEDAKILMQELKNADRPINHIQIARSIERLLILIDELAEDFQEMTDALKQIVASVERLKIE